MTNYTFIATVELYIDEHTRQTEHCLIYADGYAEAAAELDKMYKGEFMSMSLKLFDISHLYFDPKHLDFIKKLLEGEV